MSSYKLKSILRKPFKGLCDSFSSKEIINSINKTMKNRFSQNYRLNVGVDIKTIDLSIPNNELATCSIWDVGEQERFEFIRSIFYKGAAFGVILRDKYSWDNNPEYREMVNKAKKGMNEKVDIVDFFDYDSQKYSSLSEENKEYYLNIIQTSFRNSLNELSTKVIGERRKKCSSKKERNIHQKSLDELINERKHDIHNNTDIVTDNGVISKDEDGCELVLHFEDMSMEDVTKVVTDLYKRGKGVEIHIKPDGNNYIVRANYKKRKKNSEGIRGFSDY